MRIQHTHGVMSLVLASCLAGSAYAADEAVTPRAEGTPVVVDVFKGPRAIEIPLPSYPMSEQRVGNEGWVQVNFMIDPRGKPYEVAVVESTGNEAFEKAAIKAVEKWTFQPAMLGEKAIDTGQNYKLVFAMSVPATGASPKFVSAYRALAKAIDAGDRAGADAELTKLEVQNLYEDAYKNFAVFLYQRKWGTEAQQLAAVKRAIARESKPRYLSKENFVAALDAELFLEMKVQDFGGAMKTWQKLQELAPKESLAKWQSTIDEVQALRTDSREYRVAGYMEKSSSWFIDLFKNRFAIVVASGRVAEIKLRCEKQYIFFHYEPAVEYKIGDRSGTCGLELVGEPGTRFELIQS